MGKDPSMPLYVNDWLSSSRVQSMSEAEELCFFRLLLFSWASQTATVPNDIEQLARLGRCTPEVARRVVEVCFVVGSTKTGYGDDVLLNDRCFDLWSERQEWRNKSKRGGVKSGQVRRKNKRKGTSTTVATKREPNANTSSSSSSGIDNSSFSSSSTPQYEEEEKAWEDVIYELSRCGLTESSRAAQIARQNGWGSERVKATLIHWRRGTLEAGALYHRLTVSHPDQPIESGWQEPEAEEPTTKPRVKKREEWSHISSRIWSEGQEKGVDEQRIREVVEAKRIELGYPESDRDPNYEQPNN